MKHVVWRFFLQGWQHQLWSYFSAVPWGYEAWSLSNNWPTIIGPHQLSFWSPAHMENLEPQFMRTAINITGVWPSKTAKHQNTLIEQSGILHKLSLSRLWNSLDNKTETFMESFPSKLWQFLFPPPVPFVPRILLDIGYQCICMSLVDPKN